MKEIAGASGEPVVILANKLGGATFASLTEAPKGVTLIYHAAELLHSTKSKR